MNSPLKLTVGANKRSHRAKHTAQRHWQAQALSLAAKQRRSYLLVRRNEEPSSSNASCQWRAGRGCMQACVRCELRATSERLESG
eukprot:762093-Rhodomonas_salina.1